MFANYFVFVIFSLQLVFGLYVNDQCTLNDGSPGICKSNNQCQVAHDLLKCKRIRPTICGFEESEPVLCCPTNNINMKSCITKNTGSISERISVKKCNEYKKCEKLRNKRQTMARDPNMSYVTVVGGTEALPGSYPYMVAIGWALVDGTGYKWNCGGSLVNDYFVLTAAHCTNSRDDSVKSSEPTMIKLGTHDLNESDESMFQHIEIAQIIKHPSYSSPLKYHDIALFRLKKKAIFGDYVKPLCLWQSENIPSNLEPIAAGWGRLGYLEDATTLLQHVFLKIINTDTCKNIYKTRRSIPNGIISEQLCAGDLDGKKDTCQGDSGGPLLIRDPDNLCTHHLIGITSFGVGCGGVNSPAVYTRVSSYIDWIESVVWPNGN